MLGWSLFQNPVTVASSYHLWLMLPLLASVAIVYKTIRTNDIRRLPLQILGVMAYMVAGMTALGVGLWLIYEYWPF